LAAAGIALAATTSVGTASAVKAPVQSTNPSAFSLEGLNSGTFKQVNRAEIRALPAKVREQKLRVIRLADGQAALVDRSMASEGIATATTPDAVDLEWEPSPNASGYVVLRDGVRLATLATGTDHFLDETVEEGHTYKYVVAPAAVVPHTRNHPVWGMGVTVPKVRATETVDDALVRSATHQAIAQSAASTTTLTWLAFIPEARISAPSVGCDYGSSYEFGGDNHGFDWTTSKYRTVANAVVTWSTKAVAGYVGVHTTHVYRKSTGALVAQKTASSADMESRKLGSGSGYVDIRMVNHAKNPFCSGGAIDGAMTMHLTSGGNWEIRSGNFRRMPNHHIYIYNGGSVTNILKVKEQSPWCLVGAAACDLYDMTGLYGSYS
jgi:hypothetical protein